MTVIDVYETMNSVYEIDLESKQYRRVPKEGKEREPDSHRLVYRQWLSLADTPEPVQVVPWLNGTQVLHILEATSTEGIFTSPILVSYERMRTEDD